MHDSLCTRLTVYFLVWTSLVSGRAQVIIAPYVDVLKTVYVCEKAGLILILVRV